MRSPLTPAALPRLPQLMAAVMQKFRERGHTEAFLDTGTGRLEAVELYLRLGFVPMLKEEGEEERRGEWEAWAELAPRLRHALPRRFLDGGAVARL